MPDFSNLLSQGWDGVKAPPQPPIGTYFGVVVKFEFGESSKKQTPFVNFTVQLTDHGDDIDESQLEGLELHKKTISTDYYLSDRALFMLLELLQSCGIDTAGRSRNETIAEMMGKEVMLYTYNEPNEKNPDRPYLKVKNMKGKPD